MKSRLLKYLQKIRNWYYRKIISSNTFVGKATILQPCIFNGLGKIELKNTIIGWNKSPGFYDNSSYIESRNKHSLVQIGESHINNNFKCIAQDNSILIGNHCLIGAYVSIINSDFHPISIRDRHLGEGKSMDVNIGDNVFIGNNVTILKGVTIGKNSVIANGSVVFDDVPENSIVKGNPAKFYKKLEY